tara:strand:- start:442 stop:867 length:426 start_codon:yes stop_codon:yes gene_type:complete
MTISSGISLLLAGLFGTTCKPGSFCQQYVPLLFILKILGVLNPILNRHICIGLLIGSRLCINAEQWTQAILHLVAIYQFIPLSGFTKYDLLLAATGVFVLYNYQPWVYLITREDMIQHYLFLLGFSASCEIYSLLSSVLIK